MHRNNNVYYDAKHNNNTNNNPYCRNTDKNKHKHNNNHEHNKSSIASTNITMQHHIQHNTNMYYTNNKYKNKTSNQ